MRLSSCQSKPREVSTTPVHIRTMSNQFQVPDDELGSKCATADCVFEMLCDLNLLWFVIHAPTLIAEKRHVTVVIAVWHGYRFSPDDQTEIIITNWR